MAATYRIVVSSINCYNSVVIDRRVQHTVHYCNGPCGALKHGLNCTVAHRSTCAELLDIPMTSAHTQGTHEPISKTLENGGSVTGVYSDDYHQTFPGRLKKGSGMQSSGSLKDITGEAINLASGKMKEFSFEKIKYSSSHVTFRKGRKVRPDSFSRRSTDLDIIYGHFTGNDENCPPFGLMQKSVMEEHKLSRSTSLEHSLNTVASLYRSSFSEESLIARILEKTKADSSASGEDIKACLDILLKCSEDLKKCTDIIKQCIKRKAMGGDGDNDSTNPDVIYKNVMSRLSSYLKRLPLELEQGRQEHSDLAELVSALHSLQQSAFSPIFGNEQPPRYEDVVQSPPISKPRPNTNAPTGPTTASSQTECHDMPSQETMGNVKAVKQIFGGPPARAPTPTNGVHHGVQTMPSSSLPYMNSRHDGFSSTNSLLSCSSDSICKDTMEALYIEEEADMGRLPERVSRAEGKPMMSSAAEAKQFFKKPGGIPEATITSMESDKLPEAGRSVASYKPKAESDASQMYTPAKMACMDSRTVSKPITQTSRGGSDDIDKLLMDLECLSQTMQKEPPLPPKMKNQHLRQGGPQQTSTTQTFSSSSPGPKGMVTSKTPVSSLDALPNATGGGLEEGGEEDDGELLLRILESIESFAQELVESGAVTGTQSKEKEVMRLLQDTLATTTAAASTGIKVDATPQPETAEPPAPPQVPSPVPSPVPDAAPPSIPTAKPAAVPPDPAASAPGPEVTETGSTLLIQQTPEVIRAAPSVHQWAAGLGCDLTAAVLSRPEVTRAPVTKGMGCFLSCWQIPQPLRNSSMAIEVLLLLCAREDSGWGPGNRPASQLQNAANKPQSRAPGNDTV
ncbi:hypothetical protein ACEWY4_006744 [Coilia grayii]|uniref:Uncharacterized protein n=1 Tax=Coilia grayii TaxID=363190 RepID=A0ABD1KEB9_9TELE